MSETNKPEPVVNGVNDDDREAAIECAESIHSFLHVLHSDSERRTAANLCRDILAYHRTAAVARREAEIVAVVERLVRELDLWNTNVEKIIGRQLDYKWEALEDARALIQNGGGA